MTISEQLPLGAAKDHLSQVVDQVEREHGRVVITKHGRPAVVMISVEDLESLEETLSVLSNPTLLADIRAAEAEGDEAAVVLSPDEALGLTKHGE